MYFNRKTKLTEIDLAQDHSNLVKQLQENKGNFCVVTHKEFHDYLFGNIQRVNNYHFELQNKDVKIFYKAVTNLVVFRNFYE